MIYLVFAWNLALTAAVEGGAMGLLFHRRDYMYYSLLANLVTNPLVNLLLFFFVGNLGWSYWPVLCVLEMGAVLAETIIYRKICDFGPPSASGGTAVSAWGKALGLSILLNGLSYGAGFLTGEIII